MSEKRKPEESGEHIMEQSERMQRALDYAWMYATAREEALQKQERSVQRELATTTDPTEQKDCREMISDIQEQLHGLREEMRSMKRSGVFDTTDEGYTPAREAIAWMETLAAEWSKGGATPEEHLLAEHESSDRAEPLIHDEGLLRQMEDSGMDRVEAAIRGRIPDHLKTKMIEALRAYAKVGDHSKLIKRATELAKHLEEM